VPKTIAKSEPRNTGLGGGLPSPVPDYVEAVLPDGRKVEFHAADLTLQDGQRVKVWRPIIRWMPLRTP
jgi:hypothetical protein